MILRYQDDVDVQEHLLLLATLADAMDESVMITDAADGAFDPPILHVNDAFSKLTGYERDEAVGRTPRLLQGSLTERRVLDHLKVDLQATRHFHGRTFNYMKSGVPFLMDWEIVPIYDTQGQSRFYFTVQRRADSGAASHRSDTLARWAGRQPA